MIMSYSHTVYANQKQTVKYRTTDPSFFIEFFYLYHFNTGQTESLNMAYNRTRHERIIRHINAQKMYRCLAEEFFEISQA